MQSNNRMFRSGVLRPLGKRLNPAREAYSLWLDSLAALPTGLYIGNVMTSWHNQQPLSETVEFFARWAQPNDELKEGCDAAVAIAVAGIDWASEAERLLAAYAV